MSVRADRRLPLDQLAPYLLEPFPKVTPEELRIDRDAALAKLSAPGPVLDCRTIFGNDRPVELEVGFGKGLFLLSAARAKPDTNFLGCEIVRKCVLFSATRIARRQLPNVKLICGDAKRLLAQQIAPGSLEALHVYFPDPWWKARHHKRRLFTAEFVADGVKAIRPGGVFHAVTDVADYFAVMRELLAARPELREVPPIPETAGEHTDDYLTSFERKFRREGRPIHRSAWLRV